MAAHRILPVVALAILAACSDTAREPLAPRFPELHVVPQQQCTFTQGYWKNHRSALEARLPSDHVIKLGTVAYTADQLIAILRTPVKGNGLVSLAHQLIAAKLNGGQLDPNIKDAVAAADALIGSRVVPPIGSGYLSPSATSSLVSQLTAFNEGRAGTPHC